MADLSPKAPGFYWVALDDGGTYFEGKPFLVEVSEEVSKAGLHPHSFNLHLVRVKVIGTYLHELLISDGGFEAIADLTIHRFSHDTSLGGFYMGSSSAEYRLNWLGAVEMPQMPQMPAEVRV